MSRTLSPPGWPRGKGYSHGIEAEGRLVFVSGQVGWGPDLKFASLDFAAQLRQALLNIKAILAEAGAGPEHVVRMTWFILDKEEYLASLADAGAVYREVMGKSFPAMAVVVVKGLIEDEARIEIETTAVVPTGSAPSAE
jgi:enamine deaminase RidA (YjgF/YER057c/UK114 family)